jgi:hypothetical protein
MIIFLDIDGVIVHLAHNPSGHTIRQDFDPACIKVLNRLTDETDADIVISSCWRHYHTLQELKDMFEKAGIHAKIIDVTPTGRDRGDEILEWIHNNEYTGDYLIVDDDIGDIEIYDEIPPECIIHVKDGFLTGGLKDEHINQVLNRGMIS